MKNSTRKIFSQSDDPAVSVPTRPVTLRDVIKDCGGAAFVAAGTKLATSSVYGGMSQGRLPLSELYGKTNYSDQLALMQRTMDLTSVEIRRLRLCI